MNRRGDWIQVFLVFFFFLLLFVALALLFLEKDSLLTTRPQMKEDLLQHKVDAVLVSLLRHPAEIDINGDGTPDPATLADALVMNVTEERLRALLEDSLPDDIPYLVTVTRGGEEVTVDHVETHGRIKGIFLGNYAPAMKNFLPRARADLPRGTTVELLWADREALSWLLSEKVGGFSDKGKREREIDWIANTTGEVAE